MAKTTVTFEDIPFAKSKITEEVKQLFKQKLDTENPPLTIGAAFSQINRITKLFIYWNSTNIIIFQRYDDAEIKLISEINEDSLQKMLAETLKNLD